MYVTSYPFAPNASWKRRVALESSDPTRRASGGPRARRRRARTAPACAALFTCVVSHSNGCSSRPPPRQNAPLWDHTLPKSSGCTNAYVGGKPSGTRPGDDHVPRIGRDVPFRARTQGISCLARSRPCAASSEIGDAGRSVGVVDEDGNEGGAVGREQRVEHARAAASLSRYSLPSNAIRADRRRVASYPGGV